MKEGTIQGGRTLDPLLHVANTFSMSKLLTLANINVAAAEEIVSGRPYETEEQLRYPLRRAGYQHVLTNLAISCMEKKVTRKEVAQLMKNYTEKGITPRDQTMESLVERAYFVAGASGIIEAQKADAIYRAGISEFWDENFTELSELSEVDEDEIRDFRKRVEFKQPPEHILAGVSLTRYQVNKIRESARCSIVVRKGELYAELRIPNTVLMGKLRLPAVEVTFLRYLLDSQLVPVSAKVVRIEGKVRIKISYGFSA